MRTFVVFLTVILGATAFKYDKSKHQPQIYPNPPPPAPPPAPNPYPPSTPESAPEPPPESVPEPAPKSASDAQSESKLEISGGWRKIGVVRREAIIVGVDKSKPKNKMIPRNTVPVGKTEPDSRKRQLDFNKLESVPIPSLPDNKTITSSKPMNKTISRNTLPIAKSGPDSRKRQLDFSSWESISSAPMPDLESTASAKPFSLILPTPELQKPSKEGRAEQHWNTVYVTVPPTPYETTYW